MFQPALHEIYLDNNATTRTDPRVVEVMLPFFTEEYANPSSSSYLAALRSNDAVEEARLRVASLFAANTGDIFFTSGTTEANNWITHWVGLLGKPDAHVIATTIEHPSVLEPLRLAEKAGILTYSLCPVDTQGMIDPDELEKLLKPNTVLVSIQAANNEIHTIQPLEEVGSLLQNHPAILYSDATQAVGKYDFRPEKLGVDIATCSFHKMYGPKGIGAVFVSNSLPKRMFQPMLAGGGQEKNRRSGTYNTPSIVGAGMAAKLCLEELSSGYEPKHTLQLRDRLLFSLFDHLPGISLNGHPTNRLPGGISIKALDVDFTAWMTGKMRLCFSQSSACSSRAEPVSYVLKAIGLSDSEARASFRMAVGRFTTEEDIDNAIDIITSDHKGTVCGVACNVQ